MFKLRKIHKYAGVLSGIFLLLLSISGFFLNHDNWKFLYTTNIPNAYLSLATVNKNQNLYNTYIVDKKNKALRLLAGFRGAYVSKNNGISYSQSATLAFYEVVQADNGTYYGATTEGVYSSNDHGKTWKFFALKDEAITAISIYQDKLLVAIDKSELVVLDIKSNIISRTKMYIEEKALNHDISLGRFVRDLHYGRGLFDDGISLLLNDFSAFWLTLLALSGYILWYLIRTIRYNKNLKKPLHFLLKIHTSSWVLLAVVPFVILVITGIFLDHSRFFGKFLHETTVSHKVLPPIYRTLKEDIWSVNNNDGMYRIGNRYGVYESDDLNHWALENKGFAYKMMSHNGTLVVSGMGAPNRIYSHGKWNILPKTPHMFKSINTVENKVEYFSTHHTDISMPKVSTTSLYTILLSIHDGSFFASWWVFVNDISSILLLLMLYTGLQLWYKRKKVKYFHLNP